MSRVTVEIIDHIAHVTLTRGDKMNAVDPSMIEGILLAGAQVKADPSVRAVVLSGDGKAFCAGLDVMSFAPMGQGDPSEKIMRRTHGDANDYQQVALIWRDIEVPVIAALHGVCFGAGFQIALGADIRIAHPETQLAVMEMKWGLVPDMGGMVLLPELTRSDVIRQLTYTAAPIDAVQGAAWGLVTELNDDPLARAKELAGVIAGKSPSAMRAAKALIDYAMSHSRTEVLLEESRAQGALIGKADQVEVITANMQKRAPVFK